MRLRRGGHLHVIIVRLCLDVFHQQLYHVRHVEQLRIEMQLVARDARHVEDVADQARLSLGIALRRMITRPCGTLHRIRAHPSMAGMRRGRSSS